MGKIEVALNKDHSFTIILPICEITYHMLTIRHASVNYYAVKFYKLSFDDKELSSLKFRNRLNQYLLEQTSYTLNHSYGIVIPFKLLLWRFLILLNGVYFLYIVFTGDCIMYVQTHNCIIMSIVSEPCIRLSECNC